MERIYEVRNPKNYPIIVEIKNEKVIVPPKGVAKYKLTKDEANKVRNSGLLIR